jgi:kynurenine formamidase
MRFRTFVIGYSLALALFVLAQRQPISVQHVGFNRSVDLTQAVDISLESSTYARLHLAERMLQAGTRIESPAKLVPGLWTVNQIPAARLRAPLVVMNVERNVAADPNYKIGVEDIARWEQSHGQIPLGAVVVARTGWQGKHGLRPGIQTAGFSEDATRFLVEGRVVLGLGSDQPEQIVPRASHTYTSRHSVYQLTNVANLNSVPESGSLLLISPEMAPGSVENRARLTAMTE